MISGLRRKAVNLQKNAEPRRYVYSDVQKENTISKILVTWKTVNKFDNHMPEFVQKVCPQKVLFQSCSKKSREDTYYMFHPKVVY